MITANALTRVLLEALSAIKKKGADCILWKEAEEVEGTHSQERKLWAGQLGILLLLVDS